MADEALYRAKESGRDRAVIAGHHGSTAAPSARRAVEHPARRETASCECDPRIADGAHRIGDDGERVGPAVRLLGFVPVRQGFGAGGALDCPCLAQFDQARREKSQILFHAIPGLSRKLKDRHARAYSLDVVVCGLPAEFNRDR